jgi:hypothetical protein
MMYVSLLAAKTLLDDMMWLSTVDIEWYEETKEANYA